MQRSLLGRQQGTGPAGVIDTLTAGFASINRQLWVLLIPIALDLFLWLGPQVSLSTVADPAIVRGTDWLRSAVLATPVQAGQDQLALTDIEAFRQRLTAMTPEINALGFLTHGPLAVPSVSSTIVGVGALQFVRGWADAAATTLGSLVLGVLIGGYFYSALAQQVAVGRSDPLTPLRWAAKGAVRAVGYLLVVVGVLLLLGVPMLLLLAFTGVLAPPVAVVGLVLAFAATIAAELYLYFAVQAIFVSHVGPLRAIQCSVSVVRRHLSATIGFVLISLLIAVGMSEVWTLSSNALQAPFGSLLGILGNAYIASGLVAASMTFYRARVDASVLSPNPQPSTASGDRSGLT